MTQEDQTKQDIRNIKAKLRNYAILEARILILLHNQGDQDTETIATKLCIKDEPEARRDLRLAIGGLVEKGLIRPSSCVTPGIAIVDELRPITGGFDHDAAIKNLELP